MLGTTRREAGIYLSIYQGKIVQEFRERPNTPGDVKERVNKAGNTIYYFQYDFVSGFIRGAKRETTDYGEQLTLTLQDGESLYRLRMQADSKYARSFFYRMAGIDLDKKVTLTPYDFTGEDGKRVVGISVQQDGDKLKYNLPEGELPEVEVKTRGGKTTYDDTDRYNYLIGKLDEFIDRVGPAFEVESSAEVLADFESLEDGFEDEDSDLPF